jgi:lipoate-protein ligase A
MVFSFLPLDPLYITMRKNWRLILDGQNDGYYNMAVDEAVLNGYLFINKPTLRIYGWSHPFVSLGYNQKVDKVLKAAGSVPFVRRITGGGSIFHDRELTYSLTCSLSDLSLPKKVKDSYKVLCSFLIEFYSLLGLKAKFAKDIFYHGLGGYGNFCFSTYEQFDLIIENKKIGGNAQRRRKDIIFQHGSIPQSIDIEKIKLVINGVDDFAGKASSLNKLLNRDTDFYFLSSQLVEAFKKVFDVEFEKEEISVREKETVEYLLENKYKQDSWNVYREHRRQKIKN